MTSPEQPKAPRPSGGSLGQRLLVAVAVLLFAAGAFYGALVVATQVDRFFYTTIKLDERLAALPGVDPGSDEDIGGGRINVLVMGLDRRPSEGQAPARTDTMFVLTMDPGSKTAGILGIPRDLWVDIPGKEGGFRGGNADTPHPGVDFEVHGNTPAGLAGLLLQGRGKLESVDHGRAFQGHGLGSCSGRGLAEEEEGEGNAIFSEAAGLSNRCNSDR